VSHPGELTMRRYLADEALDAVVLTHLKDCGECDGRLRALRDEQAAFEQQIPFERFAAGVEKAMRVQQRTPVTRKSNNLNIGLALAATVLMLLGVQLALQSKPTSRVKGGEETVEFVIAGASGQRTAAPVETLAPGERVRVGVAGHRYAAAVSIDERGEVSTIYSEALEGPGRVWLPDSFEFTGSGKELVVVVVSDEAIDTQRLGTQLAERFKAGGDLAQLGTLDVNGVQVHRTFIKP
jgi:hypothetical protein